MILGHHLIFTAYGFWLPNDPRGSWSDFVRSWELLRFGRATHTHSDRSTAHAPHNRGARQAAKAALAHAPVEFTGLQCRQIGEGFKAYVRRTGPQVMACSILPQHVHMVVSRHRYGPRQIVGLFKGEASKSLLVAGLHPFETPNADGTWPSPWGVKSWSVFLDTEADIVRAVQYVVENPIKEGKPRQHWSFVNEPWWPGKDQEPKW